jgi:LacI family transcriptional regulator
MRDVAELSGVNQASVSVVLNGARSGGGVSEATRARIVQAAQELGYRRNSGAANMKSGRSGWLSLLLAYNEPLSALNDGLMQGAGKEMVQHNLHLHVEGLSVESLYDEALWPRALREWMSDGIIVSYGKRDVPELEALIQRHRVPVIWTNARREADCIYPDDEGGFFAATQELLALGHQRIAYMFGGSAEHYSTEDRRAGYERAMRDAGYMPDVIHGAEQGSEEERYQLIRSIIKRPAAQRPTAVLCYSDEDALNFWSAALEVGLRVPQDLSLIASVSRPKSLQGKRLSGLQLPFEQVGAGAVRLLLQKIEEPQRSLPPQAVAFEASQGDTHTQPPR